jgi:Antibiotic biosynthesis monooxygenase
MRTVIVRYTVKPDRVAENEELVRAVYEELQSAQPAGLRYATLRLDDGVSFVHIAETAEGANPLPGQPAFQRFQENIAERCDEQPVVTEVKVVGSFNLLEGRT